MKFRVEWEAEIDGDLISGVETEASWFLIDQHGFMYEYGPCNPIRPVGESYKKCVPLFKIGEEWISFDEIERRLTQKGGE